MKEKNIKETYDTKKEIDRVIIVGVESDDGLLDMNTSLDELTELVETAGGEVVGRLIQNLDKKNPKTYIGSGKVGELKVLVEGHEANAIVCDDELTSVQVKNLEFELGVKILDRTAVILDIFAGRATSAEGQIQVELAQLKYKSSHMLGQGIGLSRQGGGIGSKGPGEKKLETDRRLITDRMAELNKSLKDIETHRELLRKQRKKTNTVVVSILGYTNAGKSTLLNTLSDAGVLAEDKLFATLDTTSRNIELNNRSQVILTDTVGFIQKLPHALIKAFRATLEELNDADILLHVVDGSSNIRNEQIQAVEDTLDMLEVADKPIILAFNKCDKEFVYPKPDTKRYVKCVNISAKTGEGLDDLKEAIEQTLQTLRKRLHIIVPFTDGHMTSFIHKNCEIELENFVESGQEYIVYCDDNGYNKLKQYEINE